MPKVPSPLTNTEVERAKPKAKEYNLADGQGLYLRVKPTGAKVWTFNYIKPITEKRTNLIIGRFPAVTLAQARKFRNEWRALLARGIDPQIHRAEEEERAKLRHLNSFLSVAERWRDKKSGEISAETVKRNWQALTLHIFPKLGAYSIVDISPTLCIATLKPLEAAGKLYQIKRLCGLINEILNFAVNSGLIPFNPCLKIITTFKKAQTRNNPRINSDELSELLQALAKSTLQPQTRALFHFQLLTMVRPNEASKAEWREFDLEQALWSIPADRMKTRKPHIVPLANQTLEILRAQYAITGTGAFVFPSRSNRNKPMNSETIAKALRETLNYKGKQTAHGLRGLARTWLADKGYSMEYAEACLSHKTGSTVSQAYNHSSYLEQRKDIMQTWADFVAQAAVVSTL